MGSRIKFQIADLEVAGELADTPTAAAIAAALPMESQVNTWGEEIYFSIPVALGLDDTAQELVEPGTIGYWPTGRALCLFFGPTPISAPGEIRPASAVNIVGRLLPPFDRLREVTDGLIIKVVKLPS